MKTIRRFSRRCYFFFNPVNIDQYPEEIETIERLENSLKTGLPLNEDDIQRYSRMLFINSLFLERVKRD